MGSGLVVVQTPFAGSWISTLEVVLSGLAWLWFLLANALAETGDRDGAEQALAEAASANPGLTLEKFADKANLQIFVGDVTQDGVMKECD